MSIIKKENLLVAIQILGGILIPKINNTTIVEIYEKYETDFKPARQVFLIWPVIYFSLIYGFYKQQYEWDRNSERFFECVTFSNLAWVYFWTKDQIELSNLSFLPLCFSLYQIIDRNINDKDLILQNALSGYLSWTLIAAILNFSSILKYKIKFNNYKKIIGFLLCFTQISLIIKQESISNEKRKKDFNKNTITYPIVGFVSVLALMNNYNNIKPELISYFICCILSFYNQFN